MHMRPALTAHTGLKRERMEVGERHDGGFWQELEEGTDMIKIHCISVQNSRRIN